MAAPPSELDALAADIRACRACAAEFAQTATAHAPRPVLQPSATARVGLLSQAPGLRAHASGLPFDDPSGDRLRAWLGVDRAAFYDPRRFAILPMAFCFPGYDAKGADLPPPKRCAALWRARAVAAHPTLELLVLIGRYAQAWHLGGAGLQPKSRRLTDTVRDWRRWLDRDETPRFFPLPHPSWRNTSWLRRNPWFEAEALPRLRAEVAARR